MLYSGHQSSQREVSMVAELMAESGALAISSPVPDYVVLSKAQTAAITGLSFDTLDRLHHNGTGPPRVQLSKRRVGYPAGPLRAWQQIRSS